MSDQPITWDDGSMVSFIDGVGYGLLPDLRTIPLGSQEDILQTLKTGEIKDSLTPNQKQVLTNIIWYREEQGFGARAGDMERGQPNGTPRRKTRSIRLPETRKRLPLRSPRHKIKNLSR